MTKYLNIIIFSILAHVALGQDAFFVETVDSLSESYIGVCEIDNGYVAVGGREVSGTGGSSSGSDGIIRLFDGEGTIIWSKQFDQYHYERFDRVIATNNYLFVFGLKHEEGVLAQQRFLSKFDLNGVHINTVLYGDTTSFFGGNRNESTLMLNDGFLITGNNFESSSSGNSGDLTKFDLEGNILWHKTYEYVDTSNYNDWINHIIDDGSGFTFLLHTQKSILPYTIWTQTVIKTDYHGNEVWRKDVSDYQVPLEMQAPNTGITTAHLASYKDGFVLLMKAIDEFSNVHRTYLVEFDTYGNEREVHSYLDSTNYRSLKFVSTDDGGLAAIGHDWFGDPNDFPKHMIIKWSEDLDFEWYARNGLDENIINWQFDGMQTSDGGYLVSGDVFKAEPNNVRYDAILTKTDCRGNVSWDYESCSINSSSDLIVFPNPSVNEFYFHLPSESQSVRLTILDCRGRQVLQKNLQHSSVISIQMNDHTNGMYFYIIETDTFQSVGKVLKI